jgi:hypothetical protein
MGGMAYHYLMFIRLHYLENTEVYIEIIDKLTME